MNEEINIKFQDLNYIAERGVFKKGSLAFTLKRLPLKGFLVHSSQTCFERDFWGVQSLRADGCDWTKWQREEFTP